TLPTSRGSLRTDRGRNTRLRRGERRDGCGRRKGSSALACSLRESGAPGALLRTTEQGAPGTPATLVRCTIPLPRLGCAGRGRHELVDQADVLLARHRPVVPLEI